ncbi:hypothetical protein Stube_52100 [Streptomyces tubercidicus]|uniref:Uncharacterized protein n=1 Tax=Streptomyces tubercidicus TaxID=47759 RepID=A0A640UYM1_9ACTN|nr:hypothetical protein Stube_52100 [Streptomyces tubercidicus]
MRTANDIPGKGHRQDFPSCDARRVAPPPATQRLEKVFRREGGCETDPVTVRIVGPLSDVHPQDGELPDVQLLQGGTVPCAEGLDHPEGGHDAYAAA